MKDDIQIIEDTCIVNREKLDPVSEEDVKNAIKGLKNGKAADYAGITSEHLKHAEEEVTPALTDIINAIFRRAEIPEELKTGILTPVLKKGKEKTIPTNYRGITVTPLIGKIIETIIKDRINPILQQTQHQLQRGFTEDTSPLMAALLITEVINECRDRNECVHLTTLDAEKAFDVVWHEGLLRKLYLDGIGGDMWRLIKSLHEGTNIQVKWNAELTDKIELRQGIRQGAKLSTIMYNRFNNGILHSLTETNLGPHIGTFNITSPTCADDLALLEQSLTNMQSLTTTVYNHTCKDRFTINPSKSETMTFNEKKKKNQQDKVSMIMGNEKIPSTDKVKHLGIERNKENTPDTECRIQTARKTSYALMGTGMHGTNGISPVITTSMWDTFIIPRMLHGIEFLNIRKKDLDQLELHQRKMLKMFQSLPDNASTTAVYLLSGKTPIEGLIDKRYISAFHGIVTNKNSIEHSIAIRQLTMKDETSNSWFKQVNKILQKYNLPSTLEMLETSKKKTTLKNESRKATTTYWNNKLTEEANERTSLKFLATDKITPGKPHLVWTAAKYSPMETKKAAVKVKLMTGTYNLGYIQARNKKQKQQQCLLCQLEPEDEIHFISKCQALQTKRNPYKEKIRKLLQEKPDSDIGQQPLENDQIFTQLVIDCTHYMDNNRPKRPETMRWYQNMEKTARDYIYAIHQVRSNKIRQIM